MVKTTQSNGEELKVFIVTGASECDECKAKLMPKSFILLKENKGGLCMKCAGLDHLIFLPSGNVALTRRSKKYSRISAVVLKWSRRRRRYERQGLLVENQAVEKAEKECDADADQRRKRQEKAALRSAELDKKYINEFSRHIRKLFPSIPDKRELEIAKHACRKYSGRVGRSASAKKLDEKAVRLAVIAHIRHAETNYDDLLLSHSCNKADARKKVAGKVDKVLRKWQV